MMKEISGRLGYFVDDEGNVWSNHWYGKLRKLKKTKVHPGREIVGFRENNRMKLFYVHRLVLETFVGACPLGMECCHSDGNGMNNKLSNLRWDTHAGNGIDMKRHGSVSGKKNGRWKHGRYEVKK